MAQTPAAVATPTVAPIVMPTLAASVPDSNFPRYDQLKPAVSFWTRVFSQYSELQSVVHSSQYPNKIFTVLDFRGDANTLSDAALARRRSEAEKDEKERVDALPQRVQEIGRASWWEK